MTPVLAVRDLVVRFATPHGVLTALDGVSLDLPAGETLGLVGESGSGKSTLGKAVVGLVRAQSGSITLDGVEIAGLTRRALRPHRGKIQMIFQDPDASLNPRLTIGRIVEEPLIVHGLGDRAERARRVAALFERVGLRPEMTGRYAHELSGGQKQRVGIARALALQPRVVIADEPVSALDVSVQGQVINLLNDLQQDSGLAYLFISHDLSVIQHVADRIVVLYLGKIVEAGTRAQLWSRPMHPYTRALLDAVPVSDPEAARARPILEGEIPSPLDPPSGCRFRTRCPHAASRCAEAEPPLAPAAHGSLVACWFAEALAAPPPRAASA